MSLHRPEKRLAVLIAVIENDLSIRDAARLHGVARGSVESWVKRFDRRTIQKLREQGVVAAAPVSEVDPKPKPYRRGHLIGLAIRRRQGPVARAMLVPTAETRDLDSLIEKLEDDLAKLKIARDIAKSYGPDAKLDSLIVKLEADLVKLKAARDVVASCGLAMPLHPVVDYVSTIEPAVYAGKGESAPRLDIRFGTCWVGRSVCVGSSASPNPKCENKTPILASGRPATVCHEHACQATKDRWKFLERKHKQSTIFPLPGMTVDTLGLSKSSTRYGWGKDSRGKERKPVNDRGGNHWPHGRPPKSTYGKKPGNISAKAPGNISPISDPPEVEAIVPADLSSIVPTTFQAGEPGNISAKSTGNISPTSAGETKLTNHKLALPVSAPETSTGLMEQKPVQVDGLGPVAMANVLPTHVRWLWRHHVPAGMLTVVFAPPGVGKGTLTAALAATVTTGSRLPDDEQPRTPGNVLFVVAEDSLNLTLRPRLSVAAADVARVRAFGPDRQLSLPRDLAIVEDAARGCALVVVDPLRALTNGDSRSRVREVLTALEGVATRTGAAVIVVHHSSKADEASPLGSQDIVGIPRSVLRVLVRGDGVRAVHQQKKNLAPDAEPAYFRIVDRGGIGAVEWVDDMQAEPEPAPRKLVSVLATADSVHDSIHDSNHDAVAIDGRSYEEIERDVFQRALQNAKGNMSKAARALRVPKATFVDKAHRYDIAPKPTPDETKVSPGVETKVSIVPDADSDQVDNRLKSLEEISAPPIAPISASSTAAVVDDTVEPVSDPIRQHDSPEHPVLSEESIADNMPPPEPLDEPPSTGRVGRPHLYAEEDENEDEPIVELHSSPVFRPVRPPKQPVPIPDVSGMKLSDKQLTWAKAAQQGNELAAKLLLDSVEKLIFKFASRTVFHARVQGILSEEDMLDIFAAVKMKLYAKIPHFDPTKAGWVTFSMNWIKQASRRWLQNYGRAVRVPVPIYSARSLVFKAQDALTASLGRAPTDEELCAAAKVTPKTLAGVRSLRHSTVALDAPLMTDAETTHLDMLAAEPAEGTSLESLLGDEEADKARQLIATLNPRERCIIENRFGIGDDEPLTLGQIGEKFGLSRERIRQLEAAAISRLRARAGVGSLDDLRAAQRRPAKAREARVLPKSVYAAPSGRYFAQIYIGSVQHHLGTFDTVAEAEAAVAAKAATLPKSEKKRRLPRGVYPAW